MRALPITLALCALRASMNGAKKETIKFWLREHSGVLSIVVVTALLVVFFLASGLPKESKKVEGIAQAQAFDGDYTGNQAKLAVKLRDNSLVYVPVNSPGSVKIGSTVCLNKNISYLGTVKFTVSVVGKCT